MNHIVKLARELATARIIKETAWDRKLHGYEFVRQDAEYDAACLLHEMCARRLCRAYATDGRPAPNALLDYFGPRCPKCGAGERHAAAERCNYDGLWSFRCTRCAYVGEDHEFRAAEAVA